LLVKLLRDNGLGEFHQEERFIFILEKVSQLMLVSEVFVEKFQTLFGIEELLDSPDAGHRGGRVGMYLSFELL